MSGPVDRPAHPGDPRSSHYIISQRIASAGLALHDSEIRAAASYADELRAELALARADADHLAALLDGPAPQGWSASRRSALAAHAALVAGTQTDAKETP